MDSRIYILTHKRLTGQLSLTETAELNRLSLIPENQSLSEEIAYLWNVSNNYFPTKDWKKDAAKQEFLKKIKAPPLKAPPVKSARQATLNWQRILGVAALILLLGWALFSFFDQKEVIEATENLEYAEIIDGTKVWLDKGARLTILEESSTERKVALEGEAFFDVTHNPTKPFSIDLGNKVFAEVLGTSFKARSTHKGQNSRISVRDGKVKLYSTQGGRYEVIISAGEDGELDPKIGAQRNKTIAIKGLMSQTEQITFNNTPLNKVLDELGLHFGISFSYDLNAIKNCRYSSVIPDDATLEETLSSLEEVHQGLSYVNSGRSTVEVTGTCQKE